MKHIHPEADPEEKNEAETTTIGEGLDVTSQREIDRKRKFRETVDKINEKYAGVFRRLSQ